MKEDKIIANLLVGSNIINIVCKDIAFNKSYIEIDRLLIEELSELIKAIIKLERWKNGDECLRVSYNEINNNIYEELADVIIMILQFSCKKRISHNDLLDETSKKLIRYYETISDKK